MFTIIIMATGILGAGLKYLEQDANRVMTERRIASPLNPPKQGLLSSINPFISAPPPTPSPQLSKEYIYAGSRLLAVEDANANAAPPADLAVWRPSTGIWWVMGGTGSQQVTVQWGISTDKTVPGDYDVDGKTDFSVFRGSESKWYVQRSSAGAMLVYTFGLSGDKLALADYDEALKKRVSFWTVFF